MNKKLVLKEFEIDELKVKVYSDRQSMGEQAAIEVGNKLKDLLDNQEYVRMIFAAAPSQNELLEFLSLQEGIDWTRVTAFHMDEYLGLKDESSQLFSTYLREKIYAKISLGKVYSIDSNSNNLMEECARYADLLKQAPIDIICMGIGENGHIAFNDPVAADFADPELVKIVNLDNISRQQQVNDGCFASLDLVPIKAITLTIPTLMSGRYLFVVVPGHTKSNAVFKVIREKN